MSKEMLPDSRPEIKIDPELVKEDIPVLSADEQKRGAELFDRRRKKSEIVVEED